MSTRYTSSSRLVGKRQEVNAFSSRLCMDDLQTLAPTRVGRQPHTSKHRSRPRSNTHVSHKIAHETKTGDNKCDATTGNHLDRGPEIQRNSNFASTMVDGMPIQTLELPEVSVDYSSINQTPAQESRIFFARQPQINDELEHSRAKPHNPLTVSSFESAPATLTFPLSCESRISMLLCGQVLIYDLKALESDPRVIIELLKATKSERTNWMTVGAFYRRSGQARSAISVMNAFIEEMKALQLSDLQLKPAFLLLSGCENDLSQQAKLRGALASEIAQHAAAAQLWLQKVFGRADRARRDRQSSSLENMEREMQNLRDRNKDQEKYISELRSVKRHLELDCAYERSLRRKCQTRLEEVEKQRDSARRMEGFALEQIKREISMRKMAEDVAHLDYQ